jgi:hypothetical protein
VASLVLYADINPELFGDLDNLLGKILHRMSDFIAADFRQLSAPGSDGLFLARWTCLSFVVISRGIANDDTIKLNARITINSLSRFGMGDGGEQSITGDEDEDADADENALRNAQRIDDHFESAKEFCVHGLREAFRPSGEEITEDQVREVLARDYEVKICMLERISALLADDRIERIDWGTFWIKQSLHGFANGLLTTIRGADHLSDPLDENTGQFQPIQFFLPGRLTDNRLNFSTQFVYLHQRLRFFVLLFL